MKNLYYIYTKNKHEQKLDNELKLRGKIMMSALFDQIQTDNSIKSIGLHSAILIYAWALYNFRIGIFAVLLIISIFLSSAYVFAKKLITIKYNLKKNQGYISDKEFIELVNKKPKDVFYESKITSLFNLNLIIATIFIIYMTILSLSLENLILSIVSGLTLSYNVIRDCYMKKRIKELFKKG